MAELKPVEVEGEVYLPKKSFFGTSFKSYFAKASGKSVEVYSKKSASVPDRRISLEAVCEVTDSDGNEQAKTSQHKQNCFMIRYKDERLPDYVVAPSIREKLKWMTVISDLLASLKPATVARETEHERIERIGECVVPVVVTMATERLPCTVRVTRQGVDLLTETGLKTLVSTRFTKNRHITCDAHPKGVLLLGLEEGRATLVACASDQARDTLQWVVDNFQRDILRNVSRDEKLASIQALRLKRREAEQRRTSRAMALPDRDSLAQQKQKSALFSIEEEEASEAARGLLEPAVEAFVEEGARRRARMRAAELVRRAKEADERILREEQARAAEGARPEERWGIHARETRGWGPPLASTHEERDAWAAAEEEREWTLAQQDREASVSTSSLPSSTSGEHYEADLEAWRRAQEAHARREEEAEATRQRAHYAAIALQGKCGMDTAKALRLAEWRRAEAASLAKAQEAARAERRKKAARAQGEAEQRSARKTEMLAKAVSRGNSEAKIPHQDRRHTSKKTKTETVPPPKTPGTPVKKEGPKGKSTPKSAPKSGGEKTSVPSTQPARTIASQEVKPTGRTRSLSSSPMFNWESVNIEQAHVSLSVLPAVTDQDGEMSFAVSRQFDPQRERGALKAARLRREMGARLDATLISSRRSSEAVQAMRARHRIRVLEGEMEALKKEKAVASADEFALSTQRHWNPQQKRERRRSAGTSSGGSYAPTNGQNG